MSKDTTAGIFDPKFAGTTYKILRFYQDDRPTEVIATGLTLEEAQAHCRREDTRDGASVDAGGSGAAWFDGYTKEES